MVAQSDSSVFLGRLRRRGRQRSSTRNCCFGSSVPFSASCYKLSYGLRSTRYNLGRAFDYMILTPCNFTKSPMLSLADSTRCLLWSLRALKLSLSFAICSSFFNNCIFSCAISTSHNCKCQCIAMLTCTRSLPAPPCAFSMT
jgi:hypothetical protein